MGRFRPRPPSPSMVVAVVALVVAMSGGAVAAVVITSKNIKNGSIQLTDISSKARKSLRGKTGKTGPSGPAGLRGPAGPTGPTGPAGTAGTAGTAGSGGSGGGSDAYATSDHNNLDLTNAGVSTDVATLNLPAGTWAVVAHIGGVNADTANATRLECSLAEAGASDSDFAKLRAQPNSGASPVIFYDESLTAVMSLPNGGTVKATCTPVNGAPVQLTSHKMTAVRVTGVTRQ